ncbi:hypothetical protein [Paenibacillus ferrarius]|uniref:hypothetical protein n=1 Tax=Paenibacillus ferrarius TaxID=1469647 RepID=UPI00117D8768|nr:hypothetical protein [Paenibacillus ferrarius]
MPKIEVLHKDLATKKWLSDQVPLGMFSIKETKGYQHIKKFILKSLNKNLLNVVDVESSGWHCFDNKWVYVHSGGTIGDTDRNIRLADKELLLQIDNHITTKEAFLESLNMLDMLEPKLTHSLLSLVLVSVITSPLMQNSLAPRFSLWLEGKSGMGKTSLSKMFTQIFEVHKLVHVYDYRKDLNKTVLNRDCVSIFDDYGVAKTKRIADLTNEKIEKLIRDIGDREPSANFTVRSEGMALFTGEKFITMPNADITSSAGRVVRVQMDNLFDKKQGSTYDPLKVEKFSWFEKSSFLSTSIADYLKWVSGKLSSNFIDHYRRDFENNRAQFEAVTDDAHSRQKDNFAHLIVALNFYLTYGLEKEFITPEECASYRVKAREVFVELLKEQLVSPLDTDVQIFMESLEELIMQEKIIVTVKGIPHMERDVLGIVDLSEKTMSLTWQPVYEIVTNHILLQSDRSDFRSDIKLGKLLKEANLIYKSNGKSTKPVSGLNGRAIQFNIDKIPNMVEAIVSMNRGRKFNNLLEEYASDTRDNERREEEKRERKDNKKELKKLKGTIFQSGNRYMDSE